MKVKEVYLFLSANGKRADDNMVSLLPWTYKEINVPDESTASNAVVQTFDGVILNEYINSFYNSYDEERTRMFYTGTYTGTYTGGYWSRGSSTWESPVIQTKTNAREIRIYGTSCTAFAVLYPKLGIGYMYVYVGNTLYYYKLRVYYTSGGITYSSYFNYDLNERQSINCEFFLNQSGCTYNVVGLG